MKVRASGDMVLIERDKEAARTSKGIFLPSISRKGSRIAKVLSVGEGHVFGNGIHRKMGVKKGDTVFLMVRKDIEIDVDGKKHSFVNILDIIASKKDVLIWQGATSNTKTPWHDENGTLKFPYQPLRDLVFIAPILPPEKLGRENLIYIPDQHRKKYHNGVGTILAVGPGHQDDKGKWHDTPEEFKVGIEVYFDLSIPWGLTFEGLDGKEHYVVICGVEDIHGIAEN